MSFSAGQLIQPESDIMNVLIPSVLEPHESQDVDKTNALRYLNIIDVCKYYL